ncbi:E3 ubiquitin- ligase SINAT2-like, partial [Olea europaea subsp. europaea]
VQMATLCALSASPKCVLAQELGNIRCLALERVEESIEVPRRRLIPRCQDIFLYQSRLRHGKSCGFRPYKQALTRIAFMFLAQDKALILPKLEGNICMNIINPPIPQVGSLVINFVSWLFNCFSYHFCLHFEAFDLGRTSIYMEFIHFMGGKHDQKADMVRSSKERHKTVRQSLDGLIIQRNIEL